MRLKCRVTRKSRIHPKPPDMTLKWSNEEKMLFTILLYPSNTPECIIKKKCLNQKEHKKTTSGSYLCLYLLNSVQSHLQFLDNLRKKQTFTTSLFFVNIDSLKIWMKRDNTMWVANADLNTELFHHVLVLDSSDLRLGFQTSITYSRYLFYIVSTRTNLI